MIIYDKKKIECQAQTGHHKKHDQAYLRILVPMNSYENVLFSISTRVETKALKQIFQSKVLKMFARSFRIHIFNIPRFQMY